MTADNREWAKGVIARRDPGFRFIWEQYHEVILDALTPSSIWVDIGCGDNPHVAEFGHHAGHALGSDLSIPEHKLALPFVQAALPSLPFRDASIHMNTLSFVVEHLRTPRADFAEIARVIRP
jgi:ubiquinone/menaquinone biosynthesis C-methylase UbiE